MRRAGERCCLISCESPELVKEFVAQEFLQRVSLSLGISSIATPASFRVFIWRSFPGVSR
jgi:hypothetical protein